jgi:hypothetical protein
MVTLNYFVDSVQNANCVNDAADFFLTPLRELFDGRTYEAVYKWDGSIDRVREVAERVDFFAQNKIFAVLLVLTIVPVVLGLALKIVAALGDADVEYDRVQRWINAQPRPPQPDGPQVEHLQGKSFGQCYQLGKTRYALSLANMGAVPAPVAEPEPLDPALAAQIYPLTKLAEVWDAVAWSDEARTRRPAEYNAVRATLVRVPNQIENRAGYWAMKNDLSHAENQQLIERTHDEMVNNITGILKSFDSGASVAEKYDTLVGLAAAADVCTPTLHEKAQEYHHKLLPGRTLEDKILAMVQQLKGNICLYLLQKAGHSWHAMNDIRDKYGKALGLSKGSADVDKRYGADLSMGTFFGEFTVAAVITYVQTELNKFNFVDQMTQFFAQHIQMGDKCGIQELVPQELDSDGDPKAFVPLKAFFSPVPQAQVDKWMSLPGNAKQKKQYDEACAELQAARQRLAKAEADLESPGADQDAIQEEIEAAKSKIALFEDIPDQYEIALRSQMNEQGVIALLLCMGVIEVGNRNITGRDLGFWF